MNESKPIVSASLTDTERQQFHDCEQVIEVGFTSFLAVGGALLTIQEGKLYRETHKTFGDYSEAVWGWSRQRAYQLMSAAELSHSLSEVGLPEPENERQARDLKLIQELTPENLAAVANYLKATTGTTTPSTSQIKAAAELAQSIDAHATVENPDTGEEVPFSALTGAQRAVILAENASNSTYERLQRQKQHIQDSVEKTYAGNWSEWPLNYAAQQMTDGQALRLEIVRVPGGSPEVTASIIDVATGGLIVQGSAAAYLKKAVLNLAAELRS